MAEQNESTTDPRYHAQQIEAKIDELIHHLREDVGRVQDPGAQALFETSAEVLGGLQKAFQHFRSKAEEAWR